MSEEQTSFPKTFEEFAEQHEFPILAKTQLMMEASLKKWENEVDQKEAAAMFRVIKKSLGLVYK